jgi:hypothetical protein
MHGTTCPRPGLERQGIAINFSTHILEAYRKAQQAEKDGKVIYIDEEEISVI